VRVPVKPAARSCASISWAARPDVSLVAPGQRGCEATAMAPPGCNSLRRSARRAMGSGQNPSELTARILSTGPPKSGMASTEPRRRSTRPARMAGALHLRAARTMTSEWSTPRRSVVAGEAADLSDRDARSEADLQDPVGRLHLQKGDDPAVASAVRGTVRHNPTRHASTRAVGAHELPDHPPEDTPSHAHGRQSTASSTLEVKMGERWYAIGEVSARTGVAPSALRYYEELGVLPRARRVSGQRRYGPDALESVAMIRLLRDVGFSLSEMRALLASRARSPDAWRDAVRDKLTELDERIAQAQVARTALQHALRCRHEELRDCPNFTGVLAPTLGGAPLEQAHTHSHTN
jgi:DNA-binding transcriptional MerR regulator